MWQWFRGLFRQECRNCLTKDEFESGLAKIRSTLGSIGARIMGLEQQLEDAEAAREAATAAQNAKIDTLITLTEFIKKELADLKASGGASPTELQTLIDRVTADTASTASESAKIDTEVAGGDGSGTTGG